MTIFYFSQLNNNVGYLRIDAMSDFTEVDSTESWLLATEQAMEKLMPKINLSDKLIIDLRSNGGGTDLVSMKILSYFFSTATRIGDKATVVNGELSEPVDIWVTPSKALTYKGAIVVLTSQATASAAEIMLIGLLARAQTKIIGEPSNGSFSDILPKTLPNGWKLGLSSSNIS